MNKADMLENLKIFVQDSTRSMVWKTSVQREDQLELEEVRPLAVYLQALPDMKSWQKKAPYVILQVLTGTDKQDTGDTPKSSCTFRMVFCLYNEDAEQGMMEVLQLIEHVRIDLLRIQIIGKKYQLDMQEQLSELFYSNESAPYFGGEISGVFRMPSVDREVYGWRKDTWDE